MCIFHKLVGTLVFWFLVGPVSPVRSESCTFSESAVEREGLGEVSWVCLQKETPCRPAAALFARAPAIIESKAEEKLGIYRRCDRPASEAGRFWLYSIGVTPVIEGTQVVRSKGGRGGRHTLSSFRFADFLGYVPAGTVRLDLGPGEVIEARQAKSGLTELHFVKPVQVMPLEGTGSAVQSVRTTVAIVGTENALRIAVLGKWDAGWGTDSIDPRIEREILWLALGTEDVPTIQRKTSATSFGMLGSGKGSKDTAERLDGKPVLQSLAVFLEGYPVENLDYLILLKESWDPAITGVELLEKQINRLLPEAHFDIVSTKTITSEFGLLQSFAERRSGGRYLESVASDRFEIPGQDLGERVRGKIRTRAREKARALGIELDPAPLAAERAMVRLEKSGLEAGNLITPEHLSRMTSALELALCLSRGAQDEVRLGILAAVSRVGLPYREEETVRTLFRTWFSGFELPQESPLAEITLGELVDQLRRPEKRAFLEKLLAKLQKLPAADAYCSVFVPTDVFLDAK